MKKLPISPIFVASFLFLSGIICADLNESESANYTAWKNTNADLPDWESAGGGGWGEATDVRVLDALGRPIENAQVYITWEISESRGQGTTKTLATNELGRAQFSLTNVEFDEEDTNYEYTVHASYGNTNINKEFTFGIGSSPRTVNMPVYMITFWAKDSRYKPMQITLRVDNKYDLKTNADGIGMIQLDTGRHTVSPVFMDLQDRVEFEVKKDDAQINLTVGLYDLAIKTIDDEGNPVSAQIYVGTVSKKSGADGWAIFNEVTKPEVVVKASYGRYKKTVEANLSQGNSTMVIFDAHPPKISNVMPQWENNNLQVRAIISDEGEYASGMSGANATVDLFYIGADNVQKKLPMYAVGYNLYEGLIPMQAGMASVRYTIQATDADGNTVSEADTFVIPTSQGAGSNLGGQPPASAISENLSVDMAIIPAIVLLVIIIVAAGYWYYKTRQAQDEQPAKKSEYDYADKEKKLDVKGMVPKKRGPPVPPS